MQNQSNDNVKTEMADSYLGRIRDFQNQLVGWAVSWNIALIGSSFFTLDKGPFKSLMPWLPLLTAFSLNIILAFLYIDAKSDTKVIVEEYGLPKISTSGKSFRTLAFTWTLFQIVIVGLCVLA